MVVAPWLDVAEDACLAVAHGEADDLDGLAADGLVVAGGGVVAGEAEGDVALACVVVAAAADAEWVWDDGMSMPPHRRWHEAFSYGATAAAADGNAETSTAISAPMSICVLSVELRRARASGCSPCYCLDLQTENI